MIKICLVLSSLAGGGAERFFLNLAQYLNRSKFEVTLILFNAAGDYQDMIPKDVKVIDLGIHEERRFYNTLKLIFRLKQALNQLKPDLIFSTMGYTNLICLMVRSMTKFKAPVIIHEAGMIRHQLMYESLASIKKNIYKFFCQFAKVIIFPAKAVRDDFDQYIHADSLKYQVFPTPIDPNYIDHHLSQPFDPKKYNLKMDKKIIVSMGRLEKIKGLDLGIRAFAQLHKEISCYYWIIGQGTEEKNLKALAIDLNILDDIFFLGFQHNPFIFLKNADVYLLPSRSEALPYALIEAMYCQCPCVVTPFNDSIGELITNDIHGLQTANFDVGQLSHALKSLLQNEGIKKMGLIAKQKAKEYSVENIIPKYEEVFTSAIKQI